MVHVNVAFRYQKQEWQHEFDIEEGATILKLKEVMILSHGTLEDVHLFELRSKGRRVADYEEIFQDTTFDFAFLGKEKGAKRAARDLAIAGQKGQAHAIESGSLFATGLSLEVDVLVRHAMPEMRSEITVKVMSTGTIDDVTKAVAVALGETSLSEVKLVRNVGHHFTPLLGSEAIGARREFLSMGKSLVVKQMPVIEEPEVEVIPTIIDEPKPPEDAKLRFISFVDGSEMELVLPEKKTIRELKMALCEEVGRGPLSSLVLREGVRGRELRDAERVESIDAAARGELQLEGISLGPPVDVSVTVMQASSECSTSVIVPDTSTVGELRNVVVASIGGLLNDLRLVRRLGSGGWQNIPEMERLNGRTEFTSMGTALERSLEGKNSVTATGPAELNITITIDREEGFTCQLTALKGSSILSLKEQLAAGDPTKQTRTDQIRLSISPKRAGAPIPSPLDDKTLITEEHLELDIVPAPEPFKRDQALALQRDIYNGMSSPDFMRKLRDLKRIHEGKMAAFAKARLELMFTVQSPLLSKYGFEPTQAGLHEMFRAFRSLDHENDAEMMANRRKLDALLATVQVTPKKG